MDPVLKDITVVQFAYPYTWTKNTGQCFEKKSFDVGFTFQLSTINYVPKLPPHLTHRPLEDVAVILEA